MNCRKDEGSQSCLYDKIVMEMGESFYPIVGSSFTKLGCPYTTASLD